MPPPIAQDDVEIAPEDASSTQPVGDVEMTEESEVVSRGPELEVEIVAKDEKETTVPSFMSYLASPVVSLVVGQDENQSLLTAHQALFSKSPYFEELCQKFVDDGSVSRPH